MQKSGFPPRAGAYCFRQRHCEQGFINGRLYLACARLRVLVQKLQ
jgi:hypothetical protein